MVVATPQPVATDGKPWTVGCNPFTIYCQNASPTEGGRPDLNRANNCGETCAAMLCEFVTGVQFYPDTIWRIALFTGQVRPDYRPLLGPSSNLDLEKFLREICNIPTTQFDLDPGQPMLDLCYKYLFWQKPLVFLFFGDHPGYAPGEDLSTRLYHWVTLFQMRGRDTVTDKLVVANPWNGQAEEHTPQEFYTWLAPSSIKKPLFFAVDRRRSIEIDTPYGPGH